MNHLIINKTWGYEIWIENSSLYCGKHLHVCPQKKCSVHYHKNKTETFYIIRGCLIVELSTMLDKQFWTETKDIKRITLNKGESLTIDPLTAHRFYCGSNESCDFIEFSTYHDDNDSYKIIESI